MHDRCGLTTSLIRCRLSIAPQVMLMTPETANGRGAIPLVTDGTLPVDLAPQPPGPFGQDFPHKLPILPPLALGKLY